ncbi:glutamate-1-semialdehyde aminotransferase [Candidatus Magnetoovum chiemensis]|nr:glutamate-1-semialdehyde aminotransferase [Candidatus Magnetoovum chiemensis]
MNSSKSEAFFKDATSIIPGGVNSPVRACGSVGGKPLFIEKAEGSKIFDVDGNSYIDYVGSWGPMILGHAYPSVVEALERVLKNGTSFGAPTPLETELARLLIEFVPSIEMARMVNSGTEAAMSALRLARGFTGRDIIIKFDGCYHGHADTLLVAAGSGVATLGIPGSPGVPESVIKNTLSIQYNNIDAFTEVMQKIGDKAAAVIVEPAAGNMGLVLPVKGFLETLRELTSKYGALLIFDEVMTGFRVGKNSAQGVFNINPDISCFGKIIGGGLPVGAYGGKKEIMKYIAPVGPVYQAGTLSGNPLAMAAGIATLKELKKEGFYEELEKKTVKLVNGLKEAAKQADVGVTACSIGSMGGLFFTSGPVNNFDDAKKSNLEQFGNFYRKMREKGIYLAPSQFEAFFVSSAHSNDDIEMTINAAKEVMQSL